MILNTTGLAKSDPRLYQVLKSLIGNLLTTEQVVEISAVSPSSPVVGVVTAVTASAPISSSGGTTPNISHDASGVTPGTYGDANNIPQLVIDVTGHVDSAVDIPITFPDDYVVMSDGNTPIPSPMDDGNGNFLYVTYTP
jgi:hypothetical protein